MERPASPTPIVVLRFVIPLIVLAGYWLLRLPYLTGQASGASGMIEWAVAIAATLAGIGFMADAVYRIYRRIVE